MAPVEKEISLKEFVKIIVSWFKYLLSKWLFIGIVSALGAAAGFWYAYNAEPTYKASISFVLASNAASGGGLMGLASQFGLDLGSGNTDAFAGDNIIALMKSRKMVQEALLKKPEGSNTSLINIIGKEMKLDKGLDENERTKGAFPFPDDAGKMTLIQDSLFRGIYFGVEESMLDVSKPDESQGIYVVSTNSVNETFSYYLTKYLVAVTSAFYIDTKLSSAKKSLAMLQNEADSIRNILGGAITSVGTEADRTFNLNPAYQVQRSGAQQSQVRVSALGTAYGEVLKNLEIAKISLQKETPLYQVIDEPVLPLLQEKPGKLMSLIAGGFIAAFIAMLWVMMKKILASF